MRFNKAYVEITDVCNLGCSFCHGTKREKRFMTVPEFEAAAGALRPFAEYIYLHIMGEPLLHPELSEILAVCGRLGFRVSLTTNGTLLSRRAEVLLASSALYRVCVSLHSFEANKMQSSAERYVSEVCKTGIELNKRGVLFSMRLWNKGGLDSENEKIENIIASFFPPPYKENRDGVTLASGVFLEYGDKFEWPDISGAEKGVRFCKGLRDQIGVLCDGTVVPCCLDAEGDIALGNIFTDSVENILASPRAVGIINGFSEGRATENLCRTCGFAENRFGK